jgi:hypothetical protein
MAQFTAEKSSWASQFSQLETEMVAALRPGEDWWDTAKNLLRHLSRPVVLAEFLRSLINSPDRLAEVAGRSISHTLGFDKIVLIDPRLPDSQQTAFRLRLHLWWPQASCERPEDIIDGVHNHFTSFSSSIVCGTLTNEIYEVRERGTGEWYHYKALPLFSNDTNRQSQFPYQGNVTLFRSHEADLSVGTIYHLPYDTLHNSFNETSQLAATLLIYGPYETQEVDLYRTSAISADAVEVKQRFMPDQLAATLQRFIKEGLEVA